MSRETIRDRIQQLTGNIFGTYGLLGNLAAESGLISNNAQNSCMKKLGMDDETYTAAVDSGAYGLFDEDRVGYGLAQWTSAGRKAALHRYAIASGKSIGDEEMQLGFLEYELRNSYKKVLKVLQSATSIREASDCVVTQFEKPANQTPENLERRAKIGEALYEEMEDAKMIIAIDAGHYLGTPGRRCMKKYDPKETKEWQLNARIADMLQSLLKDYNCTTIRVDDPTGQTEIELDARCKAANEAKADIYLSIHHNGGVGGGTGGGTVVFYYSSAEARKAQASDLYNCIVAKTKLIGNRSTKVAKKALYVLSQTKMPAFLIENGFMDSSTDVPIIITQNHAEKTAESIVDFLVKDFGVKRVGAEQNQVQVNDYSLVFDAEYYSARYADLRAAFGTDKQLLLKHFIEYGMAEGRQAIETFDVIEYKQRYADLRAAFGENLSLYYNHYIEYGRKEGRVATR